MNIFSRVLGFLCDGVFMVLGSVLIMLLVFNSVFNIMYRPFPLGSVVVFATLCLLFVAGMIRLIVKLDRN